MGEDIIFGLHAVAAALNRGPDRLHEIRIARERRDPRLRSLVQEARAHGVRVKTTSHSDLDALCNHANHQGVAAVRQAAVRGWREEDLPTLLAVESEPLVLVLDGVQDPHNLGACLRSADAAGVHAVLAPGDRAVGLTPVVRKVASGAAETVPFIQVTNLARSLRALQEQGVWLVGATGEAPTSLYDTDLSGPTAIVLGAEGKGLRRLTRSTCDTLAHIPMAGSVKSLNVAVATGLFLFEAIRQRRLSRQP